MRNTLSLWLALLLPGAALANDFPTQARVEFVLGCMNEQGGQSYDTLYKCVCLVDAIAAEMSHEEFAASAGFQPAPVDGRRTRRRVPRSRPGALAGRQARGRLERGKAQCFIRK